MTDAKRRARIDAKIHAELTSDQPPHLYWLSCVDPNRPEGQRFVRVAIVEAYGPATAMANAWALGCNPGGEIDFTELPEFPRESFAPYLNRLLNEEELRAAGLV